MQNGQNNPYQWVWTLVDSKVSIFTAKMSLKLICVYANNR